MSSTNETTTSTTSTSLLTWLRVLSISWVVIGIAFVLPSLVLPIPLDWGDVLMGMNSMGMGGVFYLIRRSAQPPSIN
jgi:hypothetical protein